MSFLNSIRIPVTAPELMGGIVMNDETNPAWLFSQRFGMTLGRVPKSDKVFVLFDKEDRCVFTVRRLDTSQGSELDIAYYPGFTKEEFKKAWTAQCESLAANAIYQSRDERFKWLYLQLNEMLKANNDAVF